MSVQAKRYGRPPDVDEGDAREIAAHLGRELRPTPGRLGDSVRIVVVVLSTVAIAEMFRIPYIATSAYLVLFLSHREAVSTILTALISDRATNAEIAVARSELLPKLSLKAGEGTAFSPTSN
jgi:hypothetical protein